MFDKISSGFKSKLFVVGRLFGDELIIRLFFLFFLNLYADGRGLVREDERGRVGIWDIELQEGGW